MYRQHFGLTSQPFGKDTHELWDDGPIAALKERFQWLLENPGVALLTGDPGVGKTSALRQIANSLNPHRYQVIYMAETDFGRVDIYRQLAIALGIEPSYRRSQLWRDIKARISELAHGKQILPVWIIDEAQNLPLDFFRDFPSFLNFDFDSRDLMTVWYVGHSTLAQLFNRNHLTALSSRVHLRVHFAPVMERERFASLIQHGLQSAGCRHTLLSDSGFELLLQGSQGIPRKAGLILKTAMRLAVPKGLNHLPDDLLKDAMEEFR
jgi:type II secretory pathway predicted ATPase ExeA